jgi:threonine-phosphate decarboxylase
MIHGGDIYTDGILKGKKLLDFSSNINPLGVPKSFVNNIEEALNSIENYPDIKYREVLKNLKAYTGIDEECFVLGNGAAEIIDLAVSCFKNILIVVPSFVEYELDAKRWGCNIEYSYLNSEMDFDYEDILSKLHKVDSLIIGNPNNPNGNIIDKAKFKNIIEFCEAQCKTIIIDEAFIEFAGIEDYSFIIEVMTYKCIFIIRALTKFFAMPGVRFGYGISKNEELLKNIRRKQNPWNINCFAELAVKHVLKDEQYIKQSRNWIKEEKEFFTTELQTMSIIEKVFTTYSNYVLCKLSEICDEELYEFCLKEDILIRKAHSFKGLNNNYVRFAIKDRNNNEKLLNVLRRIS